MSGLNYKFGLMMIYKNMNNDGLGVRIPPEAQNSKGFYCVPASSQKKMRSPKNVVLAGPIKYGFVAFVQGLGYRRSEPETEVRILYAMLNNTIMKRFKIKPGINALVRVWVLEEKRCLKKWKQVFKHEKLNVVIGMKNHLLSPERSYTVENNVSPEDDVKFFRSKHDVSEDD